MSDDNQIPEIRISQGSDTDSDQEDPNTQTWLESKSDHQIGLVGTPIKTSISNLQDKKAFLRDLWFSDSDTEITETKSEPSTPSSLVRSTIYKFENLGSVKGASNIDTSVPEPKATRSNSNLEWNKIADLETIDPSLRYSKSKSKTKKQFKMAEERYDHLKNIQDKFETSVGVIITDVTAKCIVVDKTDVQIEELKEQISVLETQKSALTRNQMALNKTIDDQSLKAQLNNFLILDDNYNKLNNKLKILIEKIQTILKEHNKKSDVSNRERFSLPTFEGDFLLFRPFQGKFKQFVKGLGEVELQSYLVQALKGEAREKVEDLINGNASYETIWDGLEEFYGDKQNISDSTIHAFFSTPKPSSSIKDFVKNFTTFKNRCKNVLELGLTTEELLTQFYLIQLPGTLRSAIEDRLTTEVGKTTFTLLTPIVSKVSRHKRFDDKYSVETISCDLGSSEITAAAGFAKTKVLSPGSDQGRPPNPQPTNTHPTEHPNGRGRGGRGRGRGARGGAGGRDGDVPYSCYICDRTGHLADFCKTYPRGPKLRERLKYLNRCDACHVPAQEHKEVCATFFDKCKYCGRQGHLSTTCDGKQHPGSYILNSASK